MGRRGARIGTVVGLLVVAVACAPVFANSSTLQATALGPLVRPQWDPATEFDDGQTIDR